MRNILIIGAGKIGSLIACLLIDSGDYHVCLADKNFNGADVERLRQRFPELKTVNVDAQDPNSLEKLIQKNPAEAVISSLPYYCNTTIINFARKFNLHYFDLTEDVAITALVKRVAEDATTALVPQCGLAPGFVNLAAHALMQEFDTLDTVKLRVGALPQQTSNALSYALTWSTDGLINEYGNAGFAIENGREINMPALEGLETLVINGRCYETFHTAGGIASLTKTYANKVQTLNYKTIRYPGHCEKIRFLMQDLRLNNDRETLKKILEKVLPKTYQDFVLIYISIVGMQKDQLVEKSYVKEIYPQKICGLDWSAIQVTTASSAAVIVDTVLSNPNHYRGMILQEDFALKDFLANRFGRCYR